MTESGNLEPSRSGSAPDWLGMARAASTALNEADGDAERLLEWLVIGLCDSPYAIAVERVREIVRIRSITRLPRSPEWLLGVIALRGEVVEIVDLRRLLGMEVTEPNRSSRIIILHGDGDRATGILVDLVRDVFRVGEDSVLEAETFESSAVVGMCQRGNEFISILDVDRLLGFSDE